VLFVAVLGCWDMTRFCIKTCLWSKTLISGLVPLLQPWLMVERPLIASGLLHVCLSFQCTPCLQGNAAESRLRQ
jgi:hypothetical protein